MRDTPEPARDVEHDRLLAEIAAERNRREFAESRAKAANDRCEILRVERDLSARLHREASDAHLDALREIEALRARIPAGEDR